MGWDDKQPVFRPIALAWWVEVAHGCHRVREASASLPPPQNRPVPPPGKTFENTLASATSWLQLACIAGVLAKV